MNSILRERPRVSLAADAVRRAPPPPVSLAPARDVRLIVKRILDLSVAVPLLVGLAPLMILVGVLIRVDSPGPALFRQVRAGRGGRRFRMYKFRSMRQGSDVVSPDLRQRNEVCEPVFKMRADPRVTRVGRWLRTWSLDELPQLWNVIRGEMSLVGPRPLPWAEAAHHRAGDLRRLSVRPGLTGPWQVAGRSAVDFERWMDLDLEYVDHWSLGTDLRILARTIPAVLSRRGAW